LCGKRKESKEKVKKSDTPRSGIERKSGLRGQESKEKKLPTREIERKSGKEKGTAQKIPKSASRPASKIYEPFVIAKILVTWCSVAYR
jgi:hypothetical protein